MAPSLHDFVDGLDYPMFIVTAAEPSPAHAAATGARGGCLVGFVSQCSIEPPRLLVCLSKANRTYRLARRSPSLAVHRLGAEQQDLAALFGATTGDRADKLAHCRWRPGPAGLPLLTDCPAWLVADVVDRVDLGDHVGFVLEPTDVSAPADLGPAMMFSAVRHLEPGHPA